MKKTKLLMIMVILLALLPCCTQNNPPQENLLNNIPHIEDSLILEIPDFPRFCDQMDIERKFVRIGDCKLYVEIEGDGVPLVLINGGPGGTHHSFHPWLSEAKDDFKLIYYDQRGCGLSDYNPGDGYSFEQAVEDLEKLRLSLNIEKWILLGHSYGGAISQYYTIKYPENIIGQILVGTVPMINLDAFNVTRENDYLNENELKKKNEFQNLFRSGKLTLSQYLYNKDLNGDWKRQNFIKPEPKRLAQMARYFIASDNTFTSDFTVYNFTNAFLNCPIPTLIAEGKYDLIWTADKPQLMQKYHPNATLAIFEKSGHNIYSDETEQFIEVIKTWSEYLTAPRSEAINNWKEEVRILLKDQFTLIENSKLFIKMIRTEGIIAAQKYYNQFKKDNPETNLFFEASLNALGYEFLFGRKIAEAIEIFSLNVKEFPESWNVYDSLGEAYIAKGNRKEAKENYEKSVKLNPENQNGINVLNELNSQ